VKTHQGKAIQEAGVNRKGKQPNRKGNAPVMCVPAVHKPGPMMRTKVSKRKRDEEQETEEEDHDDEDGEGIQEDAATYEASKAMVEQDSDAVSV
jgi:hypothetical protein